VIQCIVMVVDVDGLIVAIVIQLMLVVVVGT
jgi:hypothetical protein